MGELFDVDADELCVLAGRVPEDVLARLNGNVAAWEWVREH